MSKEQTNPPLEQALSECERLRQEVILLKAQNEALDQSLRQAEEDRDAYMKHLCHLVAKEGMSVEESEKWFRALFESVSKGEDKLLSSEEAMEFLFGQDEHDQLKRSA